MIYVDTSTSHSGEVDENFVEFGAVCFSIGKCRLCRVVFCHCGKIRVIVLAHFEI